MAMDKKDLKAQQESLGLSKERRDLDVEHMKTLSKISLMHGEVKKNTAEQNRNIAAIGKIQKDLYNDVKGQSDQVLKQLKGKYKIQKVEQRILQLAQEARVGTRDQLKGVSKVLEVARTGHKLAVDQAKNMANVGKANWKAVDTSAAHLDLEKKKNEILETYGTRDPKRAKALLGQLDIEKQHLNVIDDENVAQAAMNSKIHKSVNLIQQAVDGVTRYIDALPGGKFMREALGFGDSKVKEVLATSREEITKMVVEGQSLTETSKNIGKSFKGVNVAMLAGVAALAILVKLGMGFSKQVDAIGDKFGATGVTGFKNDLIEADAAMIRLGHAAGSAGTAAAELSENFGVAFDKAIQMAPAVGDISKALGMSVKDGAALIGQLTEIGGLSEEAALQLASATDQLATANGVAPAAVMKDIQKNTKQFARFMKDGGKNIAKAAIMAKKLGADLGTIAGVADSLLDFQNSLNSEYEASAIIGKRLNFQKARELALNNDIEGAMGAVLEQLGGEEEFNKMNAIQRDALAKSIGVGVDQLAKFVGKQDESTTLAGQLESQKPWEEMAGKEAISSLSQVVNSFKSLGASLTAVLGPALNFVLKPTAALFQWFAKFGPMVKVIAATMATLLLPTLVAYTTQLYATIKAKALLAAEFIKNNALQIKNTAVTMANTVGKIAGAVATGVLTVATSLASAMTWLFNAALLANPITWIVVGIIALIAAFAWLIKKIGGVQKAFEIMGKAVKMALTIAFAPLIMAWKIIKAVGNFIGKLLGFGGGEKSGGGGEAKRGPRAQYMYEKRQKQSGGVANDFISRPGEPIQKFSGDDTIMGAKGLNFDVSPVVSAINTLKGEMTGLREEMKGYLASGGTLERGIGKGTVAAIDDAAV